MTPKSCKYVGQKTQDTFSCNYENTCKSMEIPTLWKYYWSLTVVLVKVAFFYSGMQVHCIIVSEHIWVGGGGPRCVEELPAGGILASQGTFSSSL